MPSQETDRAVDLALRIGELLLSSGAGAADVTATMLSVARACGLRHATADVTFTQVSLNYNPGADEPALNRVRHVTRRQIDYEDLTLVDHIVGDLVFGRIKREEARDRLNRVVSVGHRRSRWAALAGSGLVGAGVALLLGGTATVCALAFVAAVIMDRIQRVMSVRRLPMFYQQVAGGLVASLIAVGSSAAGLGADPSGVITACIIMLLAGIGFMGAMQDVLTGFPITASARLLEALLATIGIIAGVSLGLELAPVVGVELGTVRPGEPGLAEASLMTFGAALAAAAFAFAAYAPRRALMPVAAVAAVGAAVSVAGGPLAVDSTWSTSAAAVTIGVISYSVAGRVRVPPLVVVVPAIVPLLPGLAIYRGLAAFGEGGDGATSLAAAFATAIALASGVILGQYVAQPLKREARRLETRLSGPRLVGPPRTRPGRR